MAVLRIHKKQQNFVILDKTCLNDESLSWGAKGLHAYLISLPDNWKVRVSDLKGRARNGRDAVRGLLSELEQAGYIQKTICRDDASGRFGGVEYLVLEIPETKNQDGNPETEKTFSVKNEKIIPNPENPSLANPETGNPLPVNPMLININRINNKKLNNKTATANRRLPVKALNAKIQSEKAAAVVFSQAVRHEVMSVEKTVQGNNQIDFLSQEDALIGSQLTQPQKQRVRALVKSMNISQKEVLIEEIEFCLLNPKHFTACGKDFSRKLNAIRGVILRGDWQTPAGMIQELHAVQNSNDLAVRQLENELREAQAEAVHFKRLLTTAKEHTRVHFETIIYQAQNKIHDLEGRIRGFLSQPQEVSC
ncbi:TPA: replication protein [Legionella pneumophila]|nr:replication protein [Legionella pneumophila]HEO1440316.1 replication protein [Legionella pneumophila]HEO1455354.1 replication protein [Legionella pneumophila]HEO1458518.1 replication protein [Legionella pneumophila]